MDIQIGRSKIARRAYGMDEIALVPGQRTLDPRLADTHWEIGGIPVSYTHLTLPTIYSV